MKLKSWVAVLMGDNDIAVVEEDNAAAATVMKDSNTRLLCKTCGFHPSHHWGGFIQRVLYKIFYDKEK